MRILILHSDSYSNNPSGELNVSIFEASVNNHDGVDVRHVVYNPNDNSHDSMFYTLINLVWSKRSYIDVKLLIQEYSPSLVHFHGIQPYLSSSSIKAAYDSGVAVVQTLHNGRWICLEGGFYRNGKYCDKCVGKIGWYGAFHGCNRGILPSLFFYMANLTGRYHNKLFNWVDKFIAVSDFIRDQHISDGFPEHKVLVKNNGVDLSRFHQFHVNSNSRNGIAYISRISESKGSNVIKNIIQNISLQIHIVGDGSDLHEIELLCKKNNYDHVKIWGKQAQEQCFEIISSVVCTVIPSQCGEAFSLVAAESMALSTPVIAADIGGLGPLIKKSGGGIGVQYDDHNAYVSAIKQLCADPELARSIGQCGRSYVDEKLDSVKNFRQLIDIYNNVLREKGRDASLF